MELNGRILSIHLQTKEQYEEGEWSGPVVSVELDKFDTYHGRVSFPNDLTIEELEEVITKCNEQEIMDDLLARVVDPALFRLLEFTSEKEREATKE